MLFKLYLKNEMKRNLLMVSILQSYCKFAHSGYNGIKILYIVDIKFKKSKVVSVAQTSLPMCSRSPWNHQAKHFVEF